MKESPPAPTKIDPPRSNGKRANDNDLSLFREVAREAAAVYAESIHHLGRKTLEAMASEKPEMRPTSWGQAIDAIAFLQSMFPPETIVAFVEHAEKQGDPPPSPDAKSKGAEGEFLEETPEPGCPDAMLGWQQDEVDLVRLGIVKVYPREIYTPTPPKPPTPPAK